MEKRFTRSFEFLRIAVMLVMIVLFVVPASVQAQTTLYSYNFNSNAQGWSGSGWENTNSGFSENSGRFMRLDDYNNYGNNQNFSIISSEIDLSGYANLNFSIDVRYKTAKNEECRRVIFWEVCTDYYDGMNIEYSTDGVSWQRLGNRGEGNSWYDQDIQNLGDGWAGDNGGWETAKIDLSADLVGQESVRFRVRFVSNGSGTDDGVAFDKVVIKGTQPISFAPADGSAPGGVDNNLSLWPKADLEVKEENGVAYVWDHRSGNNNHVFQSNYVGQLQFIPEALNYTSVVYFDQEPFMERT